MLFFPPRLVNPIQHPLIKVFERWTMHQNKQPMSMVCDPFVYCRGKRKRKNQTNKQRKKQQKETTTIIKKNSTLPF